MKETVNIGFIGNPNCGKTTLFNAYTGARLKVANWPGVTVEKKEGSMDYHGHEFKLVDLPGIYSLTSYTMEEKVSREFILSDDADVIVDIADASSLERNLYLTLQLIELGKPVVLALNMMDIVEERGMEIDMHRLPEMLGIPVVPVSARKKRGLDVLMHAVAHHHHEEDNENVVLVHDHDDSESSHKHDHHAEYAMVYSDLIEDKIDLVSDELRKRYPEIRNYRWHALKLLERDSDIMEKYPVDMPDVLDRSYEKDIINQKYDFIEEIIQEVVMNKAQKAERTDKVDAVLTHSFWGAPIFLGVMALVFALTFTIGDGIKGAFVEPAIEWCSEGILNVLLALNVSDVLVSLIIDGIVAGVGTILTFLPNIFILFLALAFLEDSGYMARVAYVMDGIMGRLGLSGRAFIPMLLGFGCTVPAVMASRALEDPRDRRKTILVTPFMSCSARLPIYVVFSQMFFADKAMLAAYSMYILGIAVALITAFVLKLMDKKEGKNNLMIELPEYKAPNAYSIAIYVWEKVKDYVTKAGTVIFVASVLMWLLLNCGPGGLAKDMSQSFGAIVGSVLEPVFAPIGLGYWQIVVALLSGLAAKEVVVSSCGVLFGISNINSEAGMGDMVAILAAMGFGAVNAYALMTFCLLYTPCTATLATIKRESGSWKWTIQAVIFQLAVAWVVTFIVYRIGMLFM
ncbi:MAG: ferrous iron transport protein B [Peptococcaceae bacterium]|nr:ferrous iron transport protein B [Peptococcaceae bacterium]